jgi:hypothetical protein
MFLVSGLLSFGLNFQTFHGITLTHAIHFHFHVSCFILIHLFRLSSLLSNCPLILVHCLHRWIASLLCFAELFPFQGNGTHSSLGKINLTIRGTIHFHRNLRAVCSRFIECQPPITIKTLPSLSSLKAREFI